MHKNYQPSILLILTLSITLISVTDFAFAQEPVVTTYAGTGAGAFENGDALSAKFSHPHNIAVADNGDVYVADTFNHRIRIIYANGTVATYAGDGAGAFENGDALSAKFNQPRDIALDTNNGNLYVADSANSRIRIIYADNKTVATYAGDGTNEFKNGDASSAKFNRPFGIDLAPNGDVYVADTTNNMIRIIYANGTVATYAGNGTPGNTDGDASSAKFNQPYDITLAPNGDVYVADFGSNKIRIIYNNTKTVDTYAGDGAGAFENGDASSAKFWNPRGIALADNGDVYVADSSNGVIRIIYANNTVATYAGDGTYGFENGDASSAKFRQPRGIALTSDGDLYVADFFNHRIRKITPPVVILQITTYAGDGTYGFENGDALSAQFKNPHGIALADNGDVYVADTFNHRIRIIYANGTVDTYAGDGTEAFKNGDASSAQFKNPRGIALDTKNGDLYVADANNHRIRIIYADNKTVATYAGDGTYGFENGNASSAQFKNPRGIALDTKNGDLYVADSSSNVIRIIYANGTVATYAGNGTYGFENGNASSAQFKNPRGIALTSDGDLYVADVINHRIRIIYADNKTVATYAGSGTQGFGNGNASNAHFNRPNDIALADNGDLYVADLTNNRIRIIYVNGTVDTFAGTKANGSTNGNISSAQFDGPINFALDTKNGDLYVADYFNNRIRKISPDAPPIIALSGANPQTIELNSSYTEFGATTNDGSQVRIDNSSVNTNQTGNYTVTYDATDEARNNATQVNRTVIVQDTIPPIITLLGSNPQFIELYSLYIELGANVDDGSPLIIDNSSVNTNQTGNYTVTYDATDTSGNNATQVNRTVIVQDTTAPVITLSGNNPQIIKLNSSYTELGATTNDNSPIRIDNSSVDTNQTGSYTVTYDATDTARNNATQVNRTIIIQDNTIPIITLTGANPQFIELNSLYIELGANVDDGSPLIIDNSSVNTNQTGNYTVTYDAGNNATQVNRTIIIQDNTIPIITLTGNKTQFVELYSLYIELGANVDDGSPLIIDNSSVNTNQTGNYTVTYDAGNNATQVNRTVIVQDTIAPIIVGTPVFDIQTSNLTITFSENITISSNGLLLSGIGYSPNTTDYSNNPTLILSFDSDVATYLTNSTTSSSEYIIYPQTANTIQDTAGNNMSILNITIDVHYIVPTDNHIINSNLVRIDVPILTNSTHTNVTISYTPTSSTITPLTGGLYTKPVSESIITLKIPSSTIITHDGNWDSLFILPRTTTLVVPTTTEGRTTTTYEPIISITLGSTDTNLDLNSTATILFENYGGQGYAVYYINPNDSTPNPIPSCDTSDIAEINTRLATIGECFIDDNIDITIYTTHLSTYGLVSTSASTTSGGILAPVSVGGGGGGSSGGGGAGSIYTGGTSPLTVKSILYKVSWETTDNKKLIEITAGPSSDNAFVTLISAKLGTVTAEPSITQPYSDRVVYLGIVDSSETFVQVKAGVYTNALFDSEIKLVDISQPTGSITFDSTSSVISPGKIVMDDDTMSDKTLDDDTMSDKTLDDDTMSDKTLDDDTMSDKTLDDDTMSDKTLDDDTMSDKTLDDDTMSDKTLDDDTMSDKTTSPGCLIATAVYGTELSQQVQMLREIRDTTLMTSIPGISFMTSFNQIYYTFSPIIADAERENPLLRQVIQTMLYPLLSSISIMTMADDSQNDVLALGLLVITINLLVYIALPTLAFIYLYKKIQSTKILS